MYCLKAYYMGQTCTISSIKYISDNLENMKQINIKILQKIHLQYFSKKKLLPNIFFLVLILKLSPKPLSLASSAASNRPHTVHNSVFQTIKRTQM